MAGCRDAVGKGSRWHGAGPVSGILGARRQTEGFTAFRLVLHFCVGVEFITSFKLRPNFKSDGLFPGGDGLLSVKRALRASYPNVGETTKEWRRPRSPPANGGFIQVLQINLPKLEVKYSFPRGSHQGSGGGFGFSCLLRINSNKGDSIVPGIPVGRSQWPMSPVYMLLQYVPFGTRGLLPSGSDVRLPESGF